MKTLFVTGSFDLYGGRPSGLAEKLASYIDCDLYNGGHYAELPRLLLKAPEYGCVFWFANVPNDLPKVRHVKNEAPHVILVTSKRNDGKYGFKEVVRRAVEGKANLLFEFSKDMESGIFHIRITDPLGCVWYDGIDAGFAMGAAMDRIQTLLSVKRAGTRQAGAALENPYVTDYLKVVDKYADTFHKLLGEGEDSFRCAKGMPSFRAADGIYVSPRHLDKKITADDFIKVWEDDGLCYAGDRKPAVDAPVHMALYKALPQVNYIIHSHCYIKGASMTAKAYPCGALQEADEILKLCNKKDAYFAVNELGHGSILMAADLKDMVAEYMARPIPEKIEKGESV